jgi:hypothetical protein
LWFLTYFVAEGPIIIFEQRSDFDSSQIKDHFIHSSQYFKIGILLSCSIATFKYALKSTAALNFRIKTALKFEL